MSMAKGEVNIRVDWQMTIGFNTARCFVLTYLLISTAGIQLTSNYLSGVHEFFHCNHI